jgi:hypothetical protein
VTTEDCLAVSRRWAARPDDPVLAVEPDRPLLRVALVWAAVALAVALAALAYDAASPPPPPPPCGCPCPP